MDGLWLAALSGLIGGGTLLVGAAVAWFVDIPKWVVAGIMALGAGVLISTLAFELVEEAAADGGLVPTVAGFLAGAIIYIVADWLVSRPRKPDAPASIVARRAASQLATRRAMIARRGRPGHAGGAASGRDAASPLGATGAGSGSGPAQAAATLAGGSGVAIAIGALIDGIPESIVLGLSVVEGGISIPIVAAIAISNFPEGLGSTAALKRSGSSARSIMLLWGGIALVTVVAAVLGFLVFQAAPPSLVAVITTVAAGSLLAMICNTMIPEAFDEQHALTGLWATVGFLAAFLLHELAG
jgi:ZIP family zinc transporter